MSVPGEKRGRRMEEAITALLAHASVVQAASSLGLSERTLFRWMRHPLFRRRYQQARRELFDRSLTLLQRGSTSAAAALLQNLRAERPTDQIKAAKCVFDVTMRGIELTDVLAQLDELRGQVAALMNDRDNI